MKHILIIKHILIMKRPLPPFPCLMPPFPCLISPVLCPRSPVLYPLSYAPFPLPPFPCPQVSYGAIVGAGVVLPDYTRVSCLRRSLASEEEDTCGSFKPKSKLAQEGSGSVAYDLDVLGPDGRWK